jgi:hypothetical protein
LSNPCISGEGRNQNVQKIVGPFGQLAEVGDGATFEKGFGFWGGEGNNAG